MDLSKEMQLTGKTKALFVFNLIYIVAFTGILRQKLVLNLFCFSSGGFL